MFERFPSLTGYEPYVLLLAVLWIAFAMLRWGGENRAASRHKLALDSGSTEPVSLHPVIDPARCVGCGACTHACPEGKILGLIGGKAQLLDPASCIGHGACKTSCPTGAIELVFGTARRGVDIPLVTPQFETTVPGLFIAGELGGMGLIVNAIEQGRQAMESIARLDGLGQQGIYDVIVVGGGPAGISATLAAKERKLSCLTLEQHTLGGTVAHYPRAKLVMTRTATLPLYGKVRFKRVRKERLLSLWQAVVQKTGVRVHGGVRVDRIVPRAWGFDVETSAGSYPSRSVLLATGRRGSPRQLGVPGEELSKVVYSLDDAAQYHGQHVLVVGGGDSALEAAIELARHPLASVTLAARTSDFPRARPRNRQALETAARDGRLTVLLEARVEAIEPRRVVIVAQGRRRALANDAVIVCIGGVLPTALLADIGVAVETKYGTV